MDIEYIFYLLQKKTASSLSLRLAKEEILPIINI